jgi:hypothetical protein
MLREAAFRRVRSALASPPGALTMTIRRLLLPCFLSALCGCTSVDDAVKKHGASAKATLARMSPIAAEARASAPLERDDPPMSVGPIVVDGSSSPRSDVNAALVYVEDLDDLGSLGMVYARAPGTQLVPSCASYVDHRTYPWDPRNPERWKESLAGFEVVNALEACAQLKWVFALRTVSVVRPSHARVVPADAGADAARLPGDVTEATCAQKTARCAFDGGRLEIEVQLYALEPFARQGRFRIDLESHDRLRVYGSPNTDSMLESDLVTALAHALADEIPKHVPGATVRGLW